MKSPAQLHLMVEIFERTRLRMVYEKDPQEQRKIGVELSNASETLLERLIENEVLSRPFLEKVRRAFLRENPQYAEDTDAGDDEG